MSLSPYFHGFVFATLAALLTISITSCIVVPIPAKEKNLLSGHAVAEEKALSIVSGAVDARDVKTRIGEPIVNLGPQRVYVYKWAVRKGTLYWFVGGYGGGGGGAEPVVASHLLFVAFDPDGKVLKSGTTTFKPFDTITEQVREWLSTTNLAPHVVGPRLGESTSRGPALLIYRPSKSPCPFPTYDSNIFKPSVAVDGTVVGDLLKGEYLASEISAGEHVITIDPVPHYRFEGQEESYFVQNVNRGRIPTTVQIHVEPDRPTYVETYLCTGMGRVEMHAVIHDAPSTLQEMRDLKPAW